MIVYKMRDESHLIQMRLIYPERFSSDGEIWTVENRLLRNWTEEWFKYLKCYVLAQSDPDPRLEDLLTGPLLSTDPHRETLDRSDYFRKC